MSDIELAISSDMAGRYVEAIHNYEATLKKHDQAGIDAYANLAFLYWYIATEPPFVFEPPIPDDIGSTSGTRFPVILTKGLVQYPTSVELNFWLRYLPSILYAEEFTKEDCEHLLHKFGRTDSLVPYLFLYRFDKNAYENERDELFEQCKTIPTCKNKYIISLIQ